MVNTVAFEPLNIDDLRIGHFVRLDCSWWKHPFATNTFKVTTNAEIKRIKKISGLALFYDPDRSDPLPDETEEELGDQSDQQAAAPEPEETPQEEIEEELPRFPPELRQERCDAFQERRHQLKRTERAYEESTKQTKAALKNIMTGDVSGLRMAENMLAGLTKTLNAERSVMALLEVMNNHDDEDDPLFIHSMNVCVLSMLVGKAMKLEERDLIVLGLGALAHDVGYLNLPREVSLTTAGFSREGLNVKLHIQQGLNGLGRVPDFPEAATQIVAQHHERLNGSGYPDRLKEPDISQLAKIVMIVDEYDELCNNPDSEQTLTPYQALSLLYQNAKIRKKCEFDEDILALLIQTLGVFPPGTIVELSDGSVGVVISINTECRTKPQVMIYDPDVPRDEAAIIDLAHDEDLKIENSLRPNELSKEAKRYLNPTRITGLFPSSSEVSLFERTKHAVS